MLGMNTNFQPSQEKISEKERLMSFGYKEEHIIVYPDGSAVLDLDRILFDHSLDVMKKSFEQSDAVHQNAC